MTEPGRRYLSFRDRIDTHSHRRPWRWVLPRWVRARICDSFDRELGVFDD